MILYNADSLQALSERVVYREHFINTFQLSQIVKKFPKRFGHPRIYFCLELGINSLKIETITYKDKKINYLRLKGGHLCAATFFGLPLSLQDNLNHAAQVINLDLGYKALLQDKVLENTYYTYSLKLKNQLLINWNKFPSLETFIIYRKCNSRYFQIDSNLRSTNYYIPKSKIYKSLHEEKESLFDDIDPYCNLFND